MTLLDHVRRPSPPASDTSMPLPEHATNGHDASPVDIPSPQSVLRPGGQSDVAAPQRAPRTPQRQPDLHTELKTRVHEELIHDLDPDQLNGDTGITSPARRAVELAAEERIGIADPALPRHERQRLASEIADEVLGLGPIEPLLRDPTITEIMVNRFDRVYYETSGIIRRAETSFRDDTHVLNIIDKILRPVSRRLDDSSPMVDARLPDGSRVNAIVPPLAVHGPSLTIRKFSRDLLSVEDLVRLGTLSRPVVDFLAACVRARANIVVSGGTGTGKTTLLNLLSAFIPEHERIVTIEDPAELQIHQDDWVSLETRPPNIEGKGQVTPARAGEERAAHAPRPDPRRRVPRGRGLRHAPGDEHGPRRIAHDHPRQRAARRAVAYREHGVDGRRSAHSARSANRSPRASTWWST